MEKYNILIVDDIKENIDVLNAILKDDYKLKAATNGWTALKIAEKFRPDLILLDIMMPEIDGYEVCKTLKKNPLTQDIPIIFVTAKGDDIDQACGFEAGAVDYISKPVSPIVVKLRVKTHLQLANVRHELELQVQARTKEVVESRLDIIKILARAAEYKDNETGMHVLRVGEYSYYTAKTLGIGEKDALMLKHASPMHDIGKIGIPDSILKKPGLLTIDEREIMNSHTTIGQAILGNNNSDLLTMASIIAIEHHEKFNGTGYPNKKKGEEINIYARIVSLCDVFDALLSTRPYKKPWPLEDIIEHIKEEKGEHFDPKVVDAFIENIDKILEIRKFYEG